MTDARALLVVPAALILAVLAGCAPSGGTDSGGSDGGAGGGDAPVASGPSCDDADLSGGWELFVDERLTVDPAPDGVLSLATADDAIRFSYDAGGEYTTYGYQLGYIDDGTVFPNDSAILFPDGHPDAPDENAFTVAGPLAPSGVDGGPYAGVLQIDATNGSGTTILASICVALATSD